MSASSADDRPSTVSDTVDCPAAQQSYRQFGPYLIQRELAHGAMGVVYHVHDTRLGRDVALKMIRGGVLARPAEIERFHREARAVAQLKHRHIVPLFDVGQIGGEHYFTMELAQGGSLRDQQPRLQKDRRAVVTLLVKVARAVQHVHEHGLLHRDLKPGNILLTNDDQPMISDFGLAKSAVDPDLTATGAAVGTPTYMAPEQAAGQTELHGPAMDIWAVGVIAYELLCGRRPFAAGHDRALADAIVHDPPPPPRTCCPSLPRDLATILLKCLEKDPARRYATATALADDLEDCLAGRPIKARPIGPVHRLARWTRRHAVALSAIVPLMIASLGLVLVWQLRPGENVEAQALAQIEAQLKRGDPVTLLDATGGPLYPALSRWLAPGQSQGRAHEPFTLAADSHTLFLLLPDPCVPDYRVDAELQLGTGPKGAGLFVCHSVVELVEGPVNAQCVARINPAAATTFLELVHHFPNRDKDSYRGNQVGSPARLALSLDAWHRIAVEVNKDRMCLSVQGREIMTLPAKARVKLAEMMLAARPDVAGQAHPVFGPRGGLGLYLEGGVASFRNVILTPSPSRP